jgi:hypothetical protein
MANNSEEGLGSQRAVVPMMMMMMIMYMTGAGIAVSLLIMPPAV